MRLKLKSCPFCGSTEVKAAKQEDAFVYCKGCYANGPQTYYKTQAIKKWNKRIRK